MPRSVVAVVLVPALALCLASCATVGPPRVPVFLEPPVLSGLDASVGPKTLEALNRLLAGSGRFSAAPTAEKALARGQTEVVTDPQGAGVVVRFRVVDGSGEELGGFSATVPTAGNSWAWTFQKRMVTGVFEEAAWRAHLLALLSGPRGTKPDEELLALRVVDAVKQGAPWSDAGLRPPVTTAFRSRFGVDLASRLDLPVLVLVEGGTGYLGNEQGEPDESPLHAVTQNPFLMAQTEVTQQLYEAVTGTNPSLFILAADAPRRPVERVTWFDAVEFCNLLSVRAGYEPVYTLKARNPVKGWPIRSAEVTQDKTKNGYRLPTEAEWEWAARGGLATQRQILAGGGDPALVAWTGGNDAGPGPVAEKAPNELGLYDLSGNVWEWCWDWYGTYEGGNDIEGPATGVMKVGRGGSWHAAPWMARVTARSFDTPGSRSNNLGFRVVRTLSPP